MRRGSGVTAPIPTPPYVFSPMPQASLLGQLVFTEHSKQFSEIPKDRQIAKNCGTTSWVYCIQGELCGDCAGSESFHIDVAVQQSLHQFHDASWRIFMFCDIWKESIGRVGEKLVGGGRGHFPEWCDLHSVCHDPKPDPNRSKWDYDICEDMKHFEMALFDRQGRWTQNVCPLDYDAHSIGVHPNAAVVLAPNKGFRAILEAIVTTCNLLGDNPRYWKYTGETSPYHWKDGGLCLTEAGRWRSNSCLWYIKRHGWEHVPSSIYDELQRMVDALPDEEQQTPEPKAKAAWVERAPLPRKRQPELPQTPSPPEPQRAKAAESKPVLQAVRPTSSSSSAARSPHDDIRQRLFSDSMQRQLFAQHVPQRPQKKIAQGTPSNVSTVPPAAPPQEAQDSLVNTTQQQPNDVAVVDLTTGADDSTRQGVTGDSSAPSQVEERLSETTVHTPSVSDSDASRRNRLVNQAKLERLKEAKHRVAKEHKDTLEKLIELDTQRRLLETEIDETQAELTEEDEAASNRSLSTSVKSSHK